MPEERFEQEEREGETEDVEAHKKAVARKVAASEEPGSEESEDVEAHARKAQHKSV